MGSLFISMSVGGFFVVTPINLTLYSAAMYLNDDNWSLVVVRRTFLVFFHSLSLLTQGNMTRLEATCTSRSYYRHVLRHTLKQSNCNHSHSPMMMMMSLVQPGTATVLILHCRVVSSLHTGAWLNQDALRLSHYCTITSKQLNS